jgi:hopanoid-associated phosphorylase
MRHAGVVAVTSLALEARIAEGPGVSVVCCNQSLHLAERLSAAIAHGASGIISFGIAGGLAPHLVAGDCIVASAVKTSSDTISTDRAWARRLLRTIPNAIHAEVAGSDVLVATPAHKAQLHAESGALAVDMESHIAARVALAHGIPFAVCRVVIDAAHRTLPPAAAVGLRADGTPDVRAVMRSLLRNPRQLLDLIRTARDAEVAERALLWARNHLGAGLGISKEQSVPEEPGIPAYAVA